jgi:Tol biopolymer transport system component
MPSRQQPKRSLRPAIATIAALALAATSGSFLTAEATTTQTERVSVSSAGVQGNGASGRLRSSVVSADGRYVAFTSGASNLVRRDTNGVGDVFVRDRFTQLTERVSVGHGRQANRASVVSDISADGRYVVFDSSASNLVRGDNNGRSDVFVRDRRMRKTVRVSKTSNGVGGNAGSGVGVISANGRFVAFGSAASNLVRGDTNEASDIFVRDRRRGTTRRVSVTSSGAQVTVDSSAPTMSATGRFVAFDSSAVNLVPGDRNGTRDDVFVRDRRAGTTRRVSVRTNGRQFPLDSVLSDMSPNGRFVVFQEGDICCNEMRIRLRDRQTGQTRLVSIPQSDRGSGNFAASVSANGRFVVYLTHSPFPDEDPADLSIDALLADLTLGTTRHISLTSSGAKALNVAVPVISADGRWVVFTSASNTVVPGDTNRTADVFIHRR